MPERQRSLAGLIASRVSILKATTSATVDALRSRVISAERLTRMYLERIEAYEESGPGINAYQLVIVVSLLRPPSGPSRNVVRPNSSVRYSLARVSTIRSITS